MNLLENVAEIQGGWQGLPRSTRVPDQLIVRREVCTQWED